MLLPIGSHPDAAEMAEQLKRLDLPPIPEVPPPGGADVAEPQTWLDEPLVLVEGSLIAAMPAYTGEVGPRGSLPPRLRAGVLERLVAVQTGLPQHFSLALLDGWRTQAFQAELVGYYGASAVDSGYVSASEGPVVPPHVTGGATDLTLCWRGQALELGTPFDAFTELSHASAFERDGDELVRDARRLLHHSMLAAGFAPYRWEWWHYSYGDANWAAWSGETSVRYAAASAD